jgi:hypothetical protein
VIAFAGYAGARLSADPAIMLNNPKNVHPLTTVRDAMSRPAVSG